MKSSVPADMHLVSTYLETASEEAFRGVVGRFARLVFTSAYRILGNQHDAEDAAQVVFEIFVRKAPTLNPSVVPGAWFYRTTWFVSQAMREDRERRVDVHRDLKADAPESAPDTLEKAEVLRNLDEAMQQLPPRLRDAIVLRFFQDCSFREIGEQLRCGEDAARKRVALGKERLRARLKRRGVVASVLLLDSALSDQAALAETPPALMDALGSGHARLLAHEPVSRADVMERAMKMMKASTIRTGIRYAIVSAASIVLVASALWGADQVVRKPQQPTHNETAMALRDRRTDNDAPRADDDADRPEGWSALGRITNAQGQPLEGAWVFADNGQPYQSMARDFQEPWRPLGAAKHPYFDGGSFTIGPARTNEKGEFSIQGIRPPVGGWVAVCHPDYRAKYVNMTRDMMRDKDTVRLPKVELKAGSRFEGLVKDEKDRPLANAIVAVQPFVPKPNPPPNPFLSGPKDATNPGNFSFVHVPFLLGDVRVVRSDKDGRFVIKGLRPIRYLFAAWNGQCPPVQRTVDLQNPSDGPPAPDQSVLKLTPGKTLTVRTVLLPDGKPLPGCHVYLGVLDRWVPVDAKGVCKIKGLSDREHQIIVAPPDADINLHEVRATSPFFITRTSHPGEVLVELPPAYAVQLEVSNARTGTPIKTAHTFMKVIWKKFDRRKYGDPAERRGRPSKTPGGYLIDGVRPGSWSLAVWAHGFLPASVDQVDVPLNGPTSALKVELEPAMGTLSGRIVDQSTNKTLAGINVEAREQTFRGQARCHNRRTTVTAKDGRFELRELWGGKNRLTVHIKEKDFVPLQVDIRERKPDEAAGRQPVTRRASCYHTPTVRILFEPGENRPVVIEDLRLVKKAKIRGVIRGPDGSPMKKYGLRLFAHKAARNLKASIWHRGYTDDKGRFSIAVPPGRYDLVYGHAKWKGETFLDLDPGKTVRLDLHSDGSLAEEEF